MTRSRAAAPSWLLAALSCVLVTACRPGLPHRRLPHRSSPPGSATVIRHVDGDTIDVQIGGRRERVRLLGIDTPETVKPNTPVQCYGPEASAQTDRLLPPGTPVRLERDVEPRDAFGRLLAYVYRASDGTFVNAELVRGGFARLLTHPPNVAHLDVLTGAVHDAQARRAGLWGRCPSGEPR